MEDVKPIITEEQAAAIRQAIGEAFRPLAEAAVAMAQDFGDHFGASVRQAAAAITAGLPRSNEEPPRPASSRPERGGPVGTGTPVKRPQSTS